MVQTDGPVAGSVMGTELHFDSDASKVEVGYWYGLVFLKMSYLDLFGLKMASKSTPKPTARKKSASFKKTMMFMQDNAPSHALKYSTVWLASKGLKDERIRTWPPSSPDLNPIENLWALLKWEIYGEGKQDTF